MAVHTDGVKLADPQESRRGIYLVVVESPWNQCLPMKQIAHSFIGLGIKAASDVQHNTVGPFVVGPMSHHSGTPNESKPGTWLCCPYS